MIEKFASPYADTYWHCSNCDHLNDAASKACSACGWLRNPNDELKTEPESPEKQEAEIEKPESDPHGKDAHDPGAKLDSGKPRLDLVLDGFSRALLAVGEVGTYGAQKYTDNGWLYVRDGINRYKGAEYRHMLAENQESYDEESKLLHAAHGAWNALARLELIIREREADEACERWNIRLNKGAERARKENRTERT